MSTRHTPAYVIEVSCDATACPARLGINPDCQWYEWSPDYKRVLRDTGWSVWAGRGLRHYCPHHRPLQGHKMREVTAL